MQRHAVRRRDIRKIADKITEPARGSDRVGTAAVRQPAFILAVEPDAVKVPLQGRSFGRKVIDPVAFDSGQSGNLPFTGSDPVQESFLRTI